MDRKRLLPLKYVKIKSVSVFAYGVALDKNFSAGNALGKHLLLTPDEKLVVAASNDPDSLFKFVKVNKLKKHVFAYNPYPKEHFIF